MPALLHPVHPDSTTSFRVRDSSGNLYAAIERQGDERYSPIRGWYYTGRHQWKVYIASESRYNNGDPHDWYPQRDMFRSLKAAREWVFTRLAIVDEPAPTVAAPRVIVIDPANDPENNDENGDEGRYCIDCGDNEYGTDWCEDPDCDYCTYCCPNC